MRVGSWVDCDPNIAHKNVKVKFFRKIDYPYPFCSLCLYEAQKRNGTLPLNQGMIPKNHRTDSKPEKDTL